MVYTVASTFFLRLFLTTLLGKCVVISLNTFNTSILTFGGVYLVYQDTKTVPRCGSGLMFQCHHPLHN